MPSPAPPAPEAPEAVPPSASALPKEGARASLRHRGPHVSYEDVSISLAASESSSSDSGSEQPQSLERQNTHVPVRRRRSRLQLRSGASCRRRQAGPAARVVQEAAPPAVRPPAPPVEAEEQTEWEQEEQTAHALGFHYAEAHETELNMLLPGTDPELYAQARPVSAQLCGGKFSRSAASVCAAPGTARSLRCEPGCAQARNYVLTRWRQDVSKCGPIPLLMAMHPGASAAVCCPTAAPPRAGCGATGT